MELVVATRNPGKRAEIAALLSDLPVRLLSAEEVEAPFVVEDRPSLEGNAEKKACEIARATGRLALADDTGLEVDALDGAPGVHSARYAGEHASYADNNARLLEAMAGIPDTQRTARFRCVMALAEPAGRVLAQLEGVLEGGIAHELRGAHGFGYDPLFQLPDGRTLAELTSQEKNQISHRGRALQALRAWLREHTSEVSTP